MSSSLRGLLGCVSDQSHEAHSRKQRTHQQHTDRLTISALPPCSTSSALPSFASSSSSANSSSSSLGGPSLRLPKVKFGVALSESVKDDSLPSPLVDMLVYIAQEGVTTTDLFRRGGNPTDLKTIIKQLVEGKQVHLPSYNFYTLASVIKKFLLKIPGGVMGPKVEKQLLATLLLDNRMLQYDTIHSIISSLATATQQLLVLLFGTWFRIVNHSEYNTMSSEAMAKSVAGSLFHTCNDDPHKVEKAVQVLQILIDDFGVANMFGRKNIKYFADMTRTGIRVREKFRYEYGCQPMEGASSTQSITEEEFYTGGGGGRSSSGGSMRSSSRVAPSQDTSDLCASSPPSPHPATNSAAAARYQHGENCLSTDNPHKKLTHVSSLSAPEVNKGYSPTQELSPSKRLYLSTSLSRFDNVRRRQMLRMKKRTHWFLSPSSAGPSGACSQRDMDHSMEDASSSEALLSDDITASECGLSDSGERLRLSSDLDRTFESGSLLCRPLSTESTPMLAPGSRLINHRHSDVVNGNHRTSTPVKQQQQHAPWTGASPALASPASPGLATPGLSPRPSPPPPEVHVTDHQVRYFMVENFYGDTASAGES